MNTTHTARPLPVDAIQWTGTNYPAIEAWAGQQHVHTGPDFPPKGKPLFYNGPSTGTAQPSTFCLWPGDWLLRTADDAPVQAEDKDAFVAAYKPANP